MRTLKNDGKISAKMATNVNSPTHVTWNFSLYLIRQARPAGSNKQVQDNHCLQELASQVIVSEVKNNMQL